MPEVRFMMKTDVVWQDALVLVAFPTAGMAANIAGHYLRRHLDLPLVGSIHIDHQAPIVAIQDGVATSPLRIHGGQVECHLGDQRCPHVYIITTDLMIQPPALQAVADAILHETRSASLVLCLDAVVRDEDDDTPDVYCTAASLEILERLRTKGVTELKEALIVGMSGQILLSAEANGLPAGALLVEASDNMPDGRAAAALIQAIDHIIPELDVDTKPLIEEAMELEQEVANAQRQAERTQQRPKANPMTYI